MSSQVNASCYCCGKETTTRCSKCKDAIFCSTECQKLLFPVHKYICSKEPTTFYFPPLTRDEATFLRTKLRHVPVGGRLQMIDPAYGGKTIDRYVAMLGLFDGPFDVSSSPSRSRVSSSLPPRRANRRSAQNSGPRSQLWLDRVTVGSAELMSEPWLSANAILARYHLNSNMRSGPRFTPQTSSQKLLGMFSLGAGDLVSAASADEHGFTLGPDSRLQSFKRMNRFLRALLYYSAMLRYNGDSPTLVTKAQVVPALDRMLEVETSTFEPMVRELSEGLKRMASSIFKQ
ncbi:hypothetical protein JCM11491_000420 [Sporobolomyces phaffii]